MSEAIARATPEQLRVIESWGEGIAVMAGAGSGKTFTLVEKVRALLVKEPEARFAAVSFTEKSASDLRAKLTRLTLDLQGRPLQGHVVTTIHGFCSGIIREYPREAGFDGDEKMLSEAEASTLWSQALDVLFFEELPPEVEAAFGPLADRESRSSLYDLLARVRNLQANGVLDRLDNAPHLRALAKFTLERYDRLKRRRGALDFNDLELGAARALESDAVAADYRRRFDLIMVDEFQDTNPVQARILTRLARPDLSNLCVVGDPKQSIYRFRDADVSVFEEFCSRMPIQVSLTRNFRSVPGILEFCNEVCGSIFASSGMNYEGLNAGLAAHESINAVEVVEIRSPEDLARLIQGEVTRGVALSDMALLLRTIRGRPEKWLKALTAAGIPLAIESGGLLWNDPRTRELACFLRWWANPANEIAGVAFLRAPWIGVPEKEIEEWRKPDPGMLHSFLRSNHPAANLLRPLRLTSDRVRPGELFLKLIELPQVEEELGVAALALWHRAEELSEEGLDFTRVADRIFQACDENRRERAVPPPKNAGQLRVMTIHGSKGLEFPHVILLDFPERAERAKAAPLLYWDREEGAYLASRDEDGDRLKKDPVELEWRRLETAKELAESKRVLYVALTRAMMRILIVLPTSDDPKKREQIAKHREKITEVSSVDFWRGWIENSIRNHSKIKLPARLDSSMSFIRPTPRVELTAARPKFHPVRPRHSVSEWNLLSRCERAYDWTVIHPVAPTEDEQWQELIETEKRKSEQAEAKKLALPATYRPKLAQSEIGTRVHRALELEDASGLRELEELLGAAGFRAEPVIEWMQKSRWMVPGDSRQAWKELAFEVPILDDAALPRGRQRATATLIGALDRLVREPDGSYVIIDFKVTGRHKTKADLLEAYRNQLNLYAWALEILVPESRGKIRAVLVHIAGGDVQEIEVPLERNQLSYYREKAEKILRGKPGDPQPNSLCAVCDYLQKCDEGRLSLTSPSTS